MQPVNTSSASNLERARLETSGAASLGAAETGDAGGGFAGFLRGAQADAATLGSPGEPARPAVPVRPAERAPESQRAAAQPASPDDGGSRHTGATRPDGAPARSRVGAERGASATPHKVGDRTSSAAQEGAVRAGASDGAADLTEDRATDPTTDEVSLPVAQATPPGPHAVPEASPTLAHWLMSGAATAPVADSAMPPPQGTAAASDDLDAAAITRDLLRGLRGRTGGVAAGDDARMPAAGELPGTARQARAGVARPVEGPAGAAAFVVGMPGGSSEAAVRPSPADNGPLAAASAALATTIGPVAQGLETLPTTPGAPVERTITTALDTPGFETAAGVTVARLVREGVQEARLQLNPLEMGPVLVRIELVDGAAHVNIGAAQAATRQAFEQTLPALAAALQADGLDLAVGQVNPWTPTDAVSPRGEVGTAFDMGADAGAGPDAGGAGHGQPQARHAASGAQDWSRMTYGGPGVRDGATPDAGVRAGLAAWRRGQGGLDLYA